MKRFRDDQRGMLFNMLLGAGMVVIILFALLNIGSYINGTISSQLVESYGAASSRTALQNRTVSTLENLTAGYDNVIDIVIISTIIMAITLPLAAVIAIKKLI